jgi:hypothetical protein
MLSQTWWYTPVIIATWEVEAEGSQVPGQPSKVLIKNRLFILFQTQNKNKGWGCSSSGRPLAYHM